MSIPNCLGCGAAHNSSQQGVYFKCEYCGRVNFLKDRKLPDFDDAILDDLEKSFQTEVRQLASPELKYNNPESKVTKPRLYTLMRSYNDVVIDFTDDNAAEKGEPLELLNTKSLKAIGRRYGLYQFYRYLIEFDEKHFIEDKTENKTEIKYQKRAWNKIPEYVIKATQSDNNIVTGWVYGGGPTKYFLSDLKNARFRGLQQSEEELIIQSYLGTITLIWKNLFRQLFTRIISLLPKRILEKDEAIGSILLSFYWAEMGFKEEVITLVKYSYNYYKKEPEFTKKKFIGWITFTFFYEEVTPKLYYPFANEELIKANLRNFRNDKKKNAEMFPSCIWAIENVSKENNDFRRDPLKLKSELEIENKSKTFQDMEEEGQGCLVILTLIGTSTVFICWLILSPVISSINIIN